MATQAGRDGGKKEARLLVDALRALSDSTRIKLLLVLAARGECNVTRLCEAIRAHQPSVSHHLSLLRRARMVRTRRDGRAIYYSLADAVSHTSNGIRIRAGGASITIEALPV